MAETADVVVITALKEELVALLEVEPQRWRAIEGDLPYHLATFDGQHGPIRVAAARTTQMAGLAAATVATRLAELLSPGCLAMCGVCAGRPEATDLGDVVIAERVFHHDHGKLGPVGFQGDQWMHVLRDTWLRTAQDMQGAAKGLHGYVEADDAAGQWWFLEQLLADRDPLRSEALRRYIPDARRPDMLERLRRELGYVSLTGRSFSLTEAGREVAHEREVLHGTLVTERPYHIHVGPMASGNYVAADGGIWTRLAEHHAMRKALAVEMEAAAIGQVAHMRSLPFVVVKGVMDHADAHKTDRFKTFAARASAEVLCAFLRRVVTTTARSAQGTVPFSNTDNREERASNEPTPDPADAPRDVHGIDLVLVPGGRFLMGSPDDDELAVDHERPRREVVLEPFWLAKTPVTNAQYRRYMKANPQVKEPELWKDGYDRDDQPVVGVTWHEAMAYCEWAGLQLPTEAQWEYACRAGTTTRYWSGDTEAGLKTVAWYSGNSGGELRNVAKLKANAWGLHDMHGNVWEWCEDTYGTYETEPRPGDGLRHEPVGATTRVIRGGVFKGKARDVRSACRNPARPDRRNYFIGFRPARKPS